MSGKRRFIPDKGSKIFKKFSKNIFSIKNDAMFCKICRIDIHTIENNVFVKHVASKKHNEYMKMQNEMSDVEKEKIMTNPISVFKKDLCMAMIAADIPFWKLKNEQFRGFLEKYTERKIPSEQSEQCSQQSCQFRVAVPRHSVWRG